VLVLARARTASDKYVSVETVAGESAESVASRLADAVNEANADADRPWRGFWAGGSRTFASGDRVALAPGVYTLAGTETGLGIPKPPLYLSCSYDKGNDRVLLRWINPPGGYDYILVNLFWKKYRHANTIKLAGTATSLVIDRKAKPLTIDDMAFQVIGLRDKVPSNGASIHVSDSGYCQSELYGIPFTARVAPSWSVWSTAQDSGASGFEQRRKYESDSGCVFALSAKPFYQLIKAPAEGQRHGIWRKFLGLTPGHTYRLSAHLNTLEMDSVKGDWSLGVCAAANAADGKDLTAQQMAGLAALPDGNKGLESGRAFHFGPGNTTRGIWETVLSGHKRFLRPAAGPHITLPEGADTLTVWVSFSCSDPNGQIAFSGVKLEDVTALGAELKTPEQVIEKEREEQAEARSREARRKRKAATGGK
jgi:hypothetical protein